MERICSEVSPGLRTGRVLMGGAAGIVAKDLILQGAVASGRADYDLWAVLARPVLGGAMVPFTASWAVAVTGFLLHLAIGVVWAGLVDLARPWWTPALGRTPAILALILALVNTAVIWTGWGLSFPALGLGPAPWALGSTTTAITLASDLAYSLVLAFTLAVSHSGLAGARPGAARP